MALPVTDSLKDVRERLDRLTRDLRETQRELQRVRLERRVSVAIPLFLIVALAAALSTGAVDAQSSSRVVAPFTVVNKTGQELFKVDDENGRVNVRAGLVQLGTGASGGGFLVVQRANNQTALGLGQRNGSFGFRVFGITGETELAGMNEAKVGGGVVVANDGNGKTRMLMSGQGQIHAVDASGRTRATMTDDGAFSIRNASGTTVARLGESPGGNGLFQVANTGGNTMVEAGIVGTGAGAVRAYPSGVPVANTTGGVLGALGMPGTFIMGFLGSK
jgi:hypothetical protein